MLRGLQTRTGLYSFGLYTGIAGRELRRDDREGLSCDGLRVGAELEKLVERELCGAHFWKVSTFLAIELFYATKYGALAFGGVFLGDLVCGGLDEKRCKINCERLVSCTEILSRKSMRA